MPRGNSWQMAQRPQINSCAAWFTVLKNTLAKLAGIEMNGEMRPKARFPTHG
jgi:hypothetical protein